MKDQKFLSGPHYIDGLPCQNALDHLMNPVLLSVSCHSYLISRQHADFNRAAFQEHWKIFCEGEGALTFIYYCLFLFLLKFCAPKMLDPEQLPLPCPTLCHWHRGKGLNFCWKYQEALSSTSHAFSLSPCRERHRTFLPLFAQGMSSSQLSPPHWNGKVWWLIYKLKEQH